MKSQTRTTKIVLMIFFIIVNVLSLNAQKNITYRGCGNEMGYNQLIAKGGDFATRYRELETFTQQYIQRIKESNEKEVREEDYERASPIIIPVVVHVLWNTAEQNISDAQIDN